MKVFKANVNYYGCIKQGSLSLPGSPFNIRRGSRGSCSYPHKHHRKGDKKPLVLSSYMDAQEHLPYADDSTVVTPMSEENGGIIITNYGGGGFCKCNFEFI